MVTDVVVGAETRELVVVVAVETIEVETAKLVRMAGELEVVNEADVVNGNDDVDIEDEKDDGNVEEDGVGEEDVGLVMFSSSEITTISSKGGIRARGQEEEFRVEVETVITTEGLEKVEVENDETTEPEEEAPTPEEEGRVETWAVV